MLSHFEYSKNVSGRVFLEEVLPKLNHDKDCEHQLKTEAVEIRACGNNVWKEEKQEHVCKKNT